jgi:hypothetical protein
MKANVYKITSPNTDKVYIGSTVRTINRRYGQHMTRYRAFMKGNTKYCTSIEVIKFGNSKIELLEVVEGTKQEILIRERYHIELNKGKCVNQLIPTRTPTEIREQKKKYYEEHKAKMCEQSKNNYKNNKDKIRADRAEACECECGSRYIKTHKARHMKTQKHIQYITINVTIPIDNNNGVININNNK